MWGTEGIYQNLEEVLDYPRNPTYTTIEPGYLKYEDRNGDGKINEYDKYYQGYSRYPQIQYGITAGADWKGFSLRMLFNGSGMVSKLMQGIARVGFYGSSLRYQQDYWTPLNTNAKYPRSSGYRTGYNSDDSAFWLIDASYFRMKNLEFSYDFAHKLIKNKNIGSFRVFFSGNNLFTITKVPDIIDPEASSEESLSYPLMRVYSFGLSFTF
jgi:hypothetical protein